MFQVIDRIRDRRGIALPVALVGLVAVSLLVTTALLSSSTESAISAAQSNGVRGLYDAEGGLQEYLRARAAAGDSLTRTSPVTVTLPENGRTVRITPSRLRIETFGASADSVMYTISLLSEPLRNGTPRGRAVVAFVRQPGEFATMSLNVKEGAVVGTDLEVGGNSQVIDRSSICADTTSDPGAVKHADGAEVTTQGSGQITGEVRSSSNSGEAFEQEILNGYTMEQYADLADIKFGNRFSTAGFGTDTNTRIKYDATSTRYRWGCPTGMNITACASSADSTYYPVVAIDANGGVVDIQGDHGQGILLVLNGHLQITGNFKFKGLILVDGYIDMAGTGNSATGAKIEGSVIAFGNNTTERSRVTESETRGSAVISYNRCAIDEAQNSFNTRARNFPTMRTPSTTFAWYEVVR